MIFRSLDGAEVFYRAHTPRWAHQPLSGAGAARKGGRLNRPGVHALYLAGSPQTALSEYHQLAPLQLPPTTLVSYRAVLQQVVDFRHGFDPALWDPIWQEVGCEWQKIAFLEQAEPPSWVISDLVLAAGASGILYPSVRTEGTNLVVYVDQLSQGDRIDHHDPDGLLPHDDASWR